MDYSEDLKKFSPFNLLGDELLATVSSQLKCITFPKNTFLFRQDSRSKNVLFLVIEGYAHIVMIDDEGKETVIGSAGKYEVLGETGFLTGKDYPVSIKVVEDLNCLILDRVTFDLIIKNNSAFAAELLFIITNRYREMFKELFLQQSYKTLGTDGAPFRTRVSEFMSWPVETCSKDEPLYTVLQRMHNKHISSVVVVNEKGEAIGLVTEKGIVNRLALEPDVEINKFKVVDIMIRDFSTISPQALYYEALLLMIREKIKYIIVQEKGEIRGFITLLDMVKSKSTGILSIIDGIEQEETLQGLKKARENVDSLLKVLISEKASAEEICKVITEFNDRLTKKIIQVMEKEMQYEGWEQPPVDFCWIVMGSGGRHEQFIRTDQDNGIIIGNYDNFPKEDREKIDTYFKKFSAKIVDGLEYCGYAKCKGNVMATNPMWRKSIDRWLEDIDHWILNLSPENVRILTIFLDFRPVYGNYELSDRLRNYVTKRLQNNNYALYYLAEDDLSFPVPLGLFHQFITEKSGKHKNELNLKLAAGVHIVDGVRIFSLKEGITATSTFERLRALGRSGAFGQDSVDSLLKAFENLLMLRIRENSKKIEQQEAPDNYVNPQFLSRQEREKLKEILLAAAKMQNYLKGVFGIYKI